MYDGRTPSYIRQYILAVALDVDIDVQLSCLGSDEL